MQLDLIPPIVSPGVAVLFARRDSVYKTLGADVFDADRDARGYLGPLPVVAHPPCRAWGRLRHFAKPRPDEKNLALHAVHAVRTWGGVLEHPAHSTLWQAADLPLPGCRDSFGGFTYVVDQSWFGHRAPKRTWLYVCGADSLPAVPFELGVAVGRVELMGTREREATPRAFALWLLDLAARCRRPAFHSGSVCNTRSYCNGCSK
ncbi:MAG: hypothetical protein ACM3X0_07335 [Bacteroidota bacterium]